jgi:hypothetical protein
VRGLSGLCALHRTIGQAGVVLFCCASFVVCGAFVRWSLLQIVFTCFACISLSHRCCGGVIARWWYTVGALPPLRAGTTRTSWRRWTTAARCVALVFTRECPKRRLRGNDLTPLATKVWHTCAAIRPPENCRRTMKPQIFTGAQQQHARTRLRERRCRNCGGSWRWCSKRSARARRIAPGTSRTASACTRPRRSWRSS